MIITHVFEKHLQIQVEHLKELSCLTIHEKFVDAMINVQEYGRKVPAIRVATILMIRKFIVIGIQSVNQETFIGLMKKIILEKPMQSCQVLTWAHPKIISLVKNDENSRCSFQKEQFLLALKCLLNNTHQLKV